VEVRTLRYFLAVAISGSTTAAANVVHVTQPALSRQVRTLERQLGFDLFDRTDKRLVLNSAGRQFFPVAADLVARFEQVERTAADIAAGHLTSIHITATRTTTQDIVAPFLATWTPEDPIPTLQDEIPARLYASLSTGADLVIGTDRPNDELAWIPLARLPVWAFAPAGHRWNGARTVALKELVDEPLYVLTPEHHSRRALDAAVRAAGLGYSHPLVELSTPEAAQAMVASGRGIATLSDDPRFGLVPSAVVSGTDRVSVRLYAAWNPAHHAAKSLQRIAGRIRDFCLDQYGPEARLSP
jgi:DNA-binding transcriptional LysR family regulator